MAGYDVLRQFLFSCRQPEVRLSLEQAFRHFVEENDADTQTKAVTRNFREGELSCVRF